MNAQSALGQYHLASDMTQAMLSAAQNGDWEGLVNIEIERRSVLSPLTNLEIDYRIAGLEEEKNSCIRNILELDQQIRALTEAWMGEMRETLASVQSQRKIAQAYGSV